MIGYLRRNSVLIAGFGVLLYMFLPIFVAAGVDMPSLALDLALGRSLPDSVPFAEVAVVRDYVRPTLDESGTVIHVKSDGTIVIESTRDITVTRSMSGGTTGAPKGVAIQHRSAVAMVRWCHAMFTPEEYAGMLVSTSISFDMSVFEIFATLAAGGKLLLAENALALPALAAKDEVVLVDTVPSAMAELLRMGGLPPSIRTVNLGGEALKPTLVRDIYEKLPGVERVVNLYGPSEDTTFSTFAVVPRDTEHPLIGRQPQVSSEVNRLDQQVVAWLDVVSRQDCLAVFDR